MEVRAKQKADRRSIRLGKRRDPSRVLFRSEHTNAWKEEEIENAANRFTFGHVEWEEQCMCML